MVFRIPWDEAAPLGTRPADVIDDEIRNVKISVAERLNDLIGFAIDDLDPKRFPGWQVGLNDEVSLAFNTLDDPVEWDTPLRNTSVPDFIDIPATTLFVPVGEAGLYLMGITVAWDGGVASARGEFALKQNEAIVGLDRGFVDVLSAPRENVSRVFSIFFLEEGDELRVDFSAPGSTTTYGKGGVETNKWWGLKLGGFSG